MILLTNMDVGIWISCENLECIPGMPIHFTVVMQNVEVVFHTVVKLDSGLILPVVVASAILWLLFEMKQTLHN